MTHSPSSNQVVVTLEFLQAIASAQQALRDRARTLRETPEYQGDNAVGRTLRESAERDFQRADMLRGWCERQRIANRIPVEDIVYA